MLQTPVGLCQGWCGGQPSVLALRAQHCYTLYRHRTAALYRHRTAGIYRHIIALSDALTNVEAGEELIRRHIFVHLDDQADKFNLLIFMVSECAISAAQCQRSTSRSAADSNGQSPQQPD